MWEWDIRVIDIQEGEEEDYLPICLGGRGAAPPEHCGGPTGYRLMLKRQGEGAAMSDTVLVEAGIQMFAAACPDEPPRLGRYSGQPWKTAFETSTAGLRNRENCNRNGSASRNLTRD